MSSKEIMVSGKPLSSLRVVDLKEELEKRGLSKSGSKKDLAERLRMNILLENQRTAQSSADEEQLPNLSTREQLAEQNPFIRDYFASQAELYHSQKVVKKLYEGMAQTPEGEQRQQQTQEEQQQESTEESEDSKGPTQVEPEETKKEAEVTPAIVVAEESSPVPQPVKEAGKLKEETSKEDQAPAEASNGNEEAADVKEAALIKEEKVPLTPSEKEQGQKKPAEKEQVKEKPAEKEQVDEKPEEKEQVDEKPEEKEQVDEKEVQEKQMEEEKVQDKQTEEKQVEEKKQVEEMEVEEKQVEEMKVEEKQEQKPALQAEEEAPAFQEKSPVRTLEADVPKEPTPEAIESIKSESKTVTRIEESPSDESKLSSRVEDSVPSPPEGEEQSQERDVQDSAESTPEEKPISETPVSKSTNEKVEEKVVDEEEEDEDEEEDADDKKDERTWKRRAYHKSPQLESASQEAAIGTIIKTEETKEKSVVSVTRSSSPGSENMAVEKGTVHRLTTALPEQMDVDEALDYGEEEAESKREHGQSTWSRRILRLKNRCAVIEKSDKKWTRVDRKPVVVTSKVLESFFPDVKPLPESEVKLEERIPKEPVAADDAKKVSKEVSEHSAEEKPAEAALSNVKRKISIIPFEETTKELTPPRNPPTDILVITNLTRPFTLMQLRELLQRTGTIQEIWVDKIKSKCLAKFEKQSEAEETRAALHGIQWPPSNPKSLYVDFTTSSEFEDVTTKDSGDKKIKNEKPTEANSLPVREWDLGKRSRSRSAGRVKRGRSGSPDRKRSRKSASPRARRSPHHDKKTRDHDSSKEEPQIKALDELFRKTTTTPCLYWLPLTPEQIAEKEELRRKRMIERERRLAEMEKLRPR